MKVITLIWTILLFSGCALTTPTQSTTAPTQSLIKPDGTNKYSIQVFKGTGADIYAKWDEDAQKQCGSHKMVTLSQQYVKNNDGPDYLIGTFKCASGSKPGSSKSPKKKTLKKSTPAAKSFINS